MGLEGNMWKISIDGDRLRKHEADEIRWNSDGKDNNKDNNKESYVYLFTEEELEAFRSKQDKIKKNKEMYEMIKESEITSDAELKALWGAESLGKTTINTPTAHKQDESTSSRKMEIFDEKEFEQSLEDFNKTVDDGEPIKEETNAEIDRIMQQMELDW